MKWLRHSPLYNSLVKRLRQRRSVKRTKGSPKSVKSASRNNGPRRWYLRVILVVMTLVGVVLILVGLKWWVGYRQATIKSIDDSYTLFGYSQEVENHVLYITEQDKTSGYYFVNDIYLISLNNTDKNLKLTRILPDFVIYNPYLDAKTALSRVYNQAVTKNLDPYIAVNSGLTNLFGITANGYTFIDVSQLPILQKLLNITGNSPDTILTNLSNVHALSLVANIDEVAKHIKTTYDNTALLKLVDNLVTYKLTGYTYIDRNYGLETKYSFGTGYEPELGLINDYVSGVTKNKQILVEQVKVEVFNGTNVPGLAARFARLLGNYSVNIVRYSNTPKLQKQTLLYVRKGTKAEKNIELIKNLLNGKPQVVDGDYEYNATGDIVLVLGDDVLQNK